MEGGDCSILARKRIESGLIVAALPLILISPRHFVKIHFLKSGRHSEKNIIWKKIKV